jgi:hypothetical protein
MGVAPQHLPHQRLHLRPLPWGLPSADSVRGMFERLASVLLPLAAFTRDTVHTYVWIMTFVISKVISIVRSGHLVRTGSIRLRLTIQCPLPTVLRPS